MNEYQDQNEWFEGQRKSGPNYGWVTLVDADTRELAEVELFEGYGLTVDGTSVRVVRRHGLPS